MKNYKQILEAVHRGINLALDDFDDNDLQTQSHGKIKNTNITKDYIDLMDLFKQVDEVIRTLDSYSSKPSEDIFMLNLSKIKFNNTDLSRIAELSKKSNIKYKINPDLITNSIAPQFRSSDGLKHLIKFIIYLKCNKADLNWIDTSNIIDMQCIFEKTIFNGDISEWDTSNCLNMRYMFKGSKFNGDISKWDVSHVERMEEMFRGSNFNKPIGNWDVSHVSDMDYMFKSSKFNQDISNWKINTWYTFGMFDGCKIEEHFKPKLKK